MVALMRRLLTAILGFSLVVTVLPLGTEAANAEQCLEVSTRHSGRADTDSILINAETRECGFEPGGDGTPVLIERVRIPLPDCGRMDVLGQTRTCIPDEDAFVCPDGSRALGRQFTRTIDRFTGAPLTDWYESAPGGCPLPPGLREEVERHFASVTLPAPAAGRDPAGEQGLVNMPLNLYADPAPLVFEVTLGGHPVTITATPTRYAWNLGPAGELVTVDPGGPYPDHTVLPVITVVGEVPVTVTTTWSATFRLAGRGLTYPVQGTATTTSSVAPITIVEARTHLVSEDHGR